MHPHSYASDLQQLYKRIDATIQMHYFKNPAKNKKQPCKKGCDDCCSQFFEISEGEAMMILEHLKTFTTEELNSIKNNLQETYDYFVSEYPDFFNAYFSNSGQEAFDSDAYFTDETRFDIRIPCPFLTEEGSCNIYTVRPLICRTTGSSFTEESDLGEICEHIHSSIDAQEWQANLESFQEEIWAASELSTLEGTEDEIIVLRQFPIFYALYELVCLPENSEDVFATPWLNDYFELPKSELEAKLAKELIL